MQRAAYFDDEILCLRADVGESYALGNSLKIILQIHLGYLFQDLLPRPWLFRNVFHKGNESLALLLVVFQSLHRLTGLWLTYQLKVSTSLLFQLLLLIQHLSDQDGFDGEVQRLFLLAVVLHYVGKCMELKRMFLFNLFNKII